MGAPAASEAARAPLKASPAPTVSIASTGKAGTRTVPPAPTATAPAAPSVTTTVDTPRATSARPAASASAGLRTSRSVRSPASISFGVR